jgi:hypothetical protein
MNSTMAEFAMDEKLGDIDKRVEYQIMQSRNWIVTVEYSTN